MSCQQESVDDCYQLRSASHLFDQKETNSFSSSSQSSDIFSRSPQLKSRDNPPSGRCLVVLGLSHKTLDSDLFALFSKYGSLEDLQIISSRGIAILYYEDTNDARLAKQSCDGIAIDDNPVSVDYIHQQLSKLWDTSRVTLPNRENGCGDVANNVSRKPIRRTSVARHRRHRRKSSVTFGCDQCEKQYSKSQYVRDHKLSVHNNSEVNYSCRVCGQTFGWRVTALNHVKRKHPDSTSADMIEDLSQFK